MDSLAESVLAGNRLALSRLLSYVENGQAEGRRALRELFPYTGHAHLIGVTGAPGTGKSSLVNHLARYYRHPPEGESPRRVAVLAVDPSSPFSGGAILGDRIRMRDLAGDPGVFIRSMAARGSLGGLAASTAGLAQVFDAAGFEVIFIETVGAGQAEVDIARLAHTTLVVEAPGLGDEIQAIKAGILEIADVLVVNKADRPGVENTERALRSMLELSHAARQVAETHHGPRQRLKPAAPQPEPAEAVPGWIPPIQRTVATEGTGIAELAGWIAKHREYLQASGGWRQREQERFAAELEKLVQDALLARWRAGLPDGAYAEILRAVQERRLAPLDALEKLTSMQ